MLKRKNAILLFALFFLGTVLALYTRSTHKRRPISPISRREEPVRLASVFQPHMVLQRNMRIPIWGWASPGALVTVKLKGLSASARADGKGKWTARIGPLKPGGPYILQVNSGGTTLKLRDVLVGDVWIASGQSNMDWQVDQSMNAEEEIAKACFPKIRLLKVGKMVGIEPFDYLSGGKWKPCAPESVGEFSGVAYFFGRHLHRRLGIPIGLIHTAFGGTPISSWMPIEDLKACPASKPVFSWWTRIMKTFPERLKRYEQIEARWKVAARKARQEGKPIPEKPYPPLGPGHDHQPAGLYNAMVYPLVPYGIKGVIWYQGEENVKQAHQYKQLFPALIKGWRRVWGQGPFPFLFVQLAGFGIWDHEYWPWLREAQEAALALPNTGMAVAIDIGEKANIHPPNKQEVGRRLALIALAQVYGWKVPYSGPVYQSMEVHGDRVRISFTHIHSGLEIRKGKTLRGFELAGKDRKFYPAQALIEGDLVVARSPKVPHPVAVRYGWAGFPGCNLYNKAGLPARPFRTDSWPAPPDEPYSYPLRYAPPGNHLSGVPVQASFGKCPATGK